MKIKLSQLRNIIKEEVQNVVGAKKSPMEFIVGVDLPLPPMYSGVDPEQGKLNAKFRQKLQTRIGHQIVLTGKSTPNPNYKVKATFSTEAEAQKLADELSAAVADAIDSGALFYDYMPPEVKQGKAGYVIDNDPSDVYGPFWG